ARSRGCPRTGLKVSFPLSRDSHDPASEAISAISRKRNELSENAVKNRWRPIVCAAVITVAVCVAALAETPPPYRAAAPLPEPALFAEGVVSTGEYESHPAFTPDGRTLCFVRSSPAFTGWTIYVTDYADGRWTAPKVASFSGKHRDA